MPNDSSAIVQKVSSSPRLRRTRRRAGELEPSGARETIRKDRPEGGRGGAHQVHYRHTLENLGTEPGLVGIIFRKAQNKISPPSLMLQRTSNPSILAA